MRRLLAVLLLALVLPTQSWAQMSLGGTFQANPGIGATTNAVTYTLTTGRGVVAMVVWQANSGETISSITVSGESNMTLVGTPAITSTNWTTQMAYLGSVTSGGSKTITVTWSGAVNSYVFFQELHDGSNGGIALDGSCNAFSNASADPTCNVTTGVANSAIFAVVSVSSNPAVGSGYTELSEPAFFNYENAEYDLDAGAAGTYAANYTAASGVWTLAAAGFKAATAAPTREQEGFRWGVDDGNEAAHTWEANQDTSITIGDNQARLLRALVNATGDPASAAYTLRAQKNGSGGYVAVPVGSTTAGSITNQTIAASSDDAQDIGGTVTLTGTTIGASLDATTEWVGLRFTNITIPKGSTITSATIGVVPSATTEDEPSVTIFFQAADDCATFTTGASDISGRTRTSASVSWSSTDLAATGSSYHSSPSLVTPLQEVIDRAGWASGNDVCVIIQGGSTGTRDLTIESYDLGPGTNPPRISIGWNAPNEVYIGTSGNIAAGGEATTARLTAPSGKTTGDFVTGRRWDDENGTDTIDITADDYTEVEWLVQLSAAPNDGDYFDFRVYAGSSPLDTYTVTPRWTVGSGATPQNFFYLRRPQ